MSASAILKLQKVGFTAEQVEALADFMDTQAASKADLERVASGLKAELAETKAELKADIAKTKAELKADIADVRSDVKFLEQRMTIKLGGMMIIAVGILMAAIRYLPPHP